MSDSSGLLSASEFVSRLNDLGTTGPAADALRLQGLAKAPDDATQASQHVLVDVVGDCQHWTALPVSLIDQVQILRLVTCQDHSHPLVAITLITPTSPDAAALAQIACAPRGYRRQPNPFRGGRTGSRWPGTRPPVDATLRADAIPSACAAKFGQAAHSFLSAFEAAAAGDQEAAAAWADQFQTDYASYQACIDIVKTLA
jgi:hypothetical protein